MNPPADPEGQFLRDALSHVIDASDALDLALDLLSDKDVETLNPLEGHAGGEAARRGGRRRSEQGPADCRSRLIARH